MNFEDQRFVSGHIHSLFGVDEVGRGPLAGPVVSACVRLTPRSFEEMPFWESFFKNKGIGDSKKVTSAKRVKILKSLDIPFQKLSPHRSYDLLDLPEGKVTYGIGICDHQEIDQLNILRASLLSMEKSFLSINSFPNPSVLLIDGNKQLPKEFENLKQIPLVKGDQRSFLIGLASIIAKEYRDDLMIRYSEEFPGYGFESHAGYPTKTHKESIERLGPSLIHRRTFRGVKEFCT